MCGCDCVGVGVIAWVRKGVCGWGSLDCFRKVHVCVCGGEGGVCVWMCGCGCDCVCVCVCVGVIAWVRKGVCGWSSLDSYHKVHDQSRTCICKLKHGKASKAKFKGRQ